MSDFREMSVGYLMVSLVEPGTERGHDDQDNIGTYDIEVAGVDEDGAPVRDDMLGRDIVRLTPEELRGWRSVANERDGHKLSHGLARNRYMVAAVMMLDEMRDALARLVAETETPVRHGLVHVCFACDETQPAGYDPEEPTLAHRPGCSIAAARALLDRDALPLVTSIEPPTEAECCAAGKALDDALANTLIPGPDDKLTPDAIRGHLRQQAEKHGDTTLAETARQAGFGPGERVKLEEDPN